MAVNKHFHSAERGAYLLSENSPFAVKEAYRTLRTNVIFSLPGTECKVIGVTSAQPSEGKSTTAASLALSFAQIDKRVLLVDCDMRLPSVAGKFRVPAAPGLSDFITGQSRIENTIHKLEEYGIHVMPAGSIPPDPTGLLEAKQLEHLFSAFRQNYDYVVVDLPPVAALPDAAIVAKYIDGYLLVARQKQTKHKAVAEMMKNLQMSGANILGFVTTGATSSVTGYYHRR